MVSNRSGDYAAHWNVRRRSEGWEFDSLDDVIVSSGLVYTGPGVTALDGDYIPGGQSEPLALGSLMRSPAFDWKDGWLLTLGFAGFAVVLGLLRGQGITLGRGPLELVGATLVLGPPALRRRLFGPPLLGPRRDGLLARLGSIVGLLALFAGLGLGALTAARLSQPRSVAPEFLATELRLVEASSKLEARFGQLSPAGESAEAVEARHRVERHAAELAARASAEEQRRAWERSEAAEAKKSWALALGVLGLLAFGSVLLALRHGPLPGAR
jgi:hypothetical protein